jgi:hypothetical protein
VLLGMVAAGSADTLVAAGMEVHRKDNIVLHLQRDKGGLRYIHCSVGEEYPGRAVGGGANLDLLPALGLHSAADLALQSRRHCSIDDNGAGERHDCEAHYHSPHLQR